MTIKVDTYRDGGTVRIVDGEKEYYIDNRIGTDTKYVLFDDYPSDGKIIFKREEIQDFIDTVKRIDSNKIQDNELFAIMFVFRKYTRIYWDDIHRCVIERSKIPDF